MQTNAKPPVKSSQDRAEQAVPCHHPGLWIEIQDLDGVVHSTSLL